MSIGSTTDIIDNFLDSTIALACLSISLFNVLATKISFHSSQWNRYMKNFSSIWIEQNEHCTLNTKHWTRKSPNTAKRDNRMMKNSWVGKVWNLFCGFFSDRFSFTILRIESQRDLWERFGVGRVKVCSRIVIYI